MAIIHAFQQHPRFVDITGQRFGRLCALEPVHTPSKGCLKWKCICDCGQSAIIDGSSLRRGRSRSCGCLNDEVRHRPRIAKDSNQSRFPAEYHHYLIAKYRCSPNSTRARDYFDRGVRFLFTSFEEFIASVGPKPSPQYSLDRINNDGHYEPGNVRWATRFEQQANRRGVAVLTLDGVSRPLPEWARILSVPRRLLQSRKAYRKWCDRCTLTLPVNYRNSCNHKELSNES